MRDEQSMISQRHLRDGLLKAQGKAVFAIVNPLRQRHLRDGLLKAQGKSVFAIVNPDQYVVTK